MARSIKKAAVANGPGKGDLGLVLEDIRVQLAAMLVDITALRTNQAALRADLVDLNTKYTLHIANGGHTAAANTTGGNVTAATPAAATASAPASLTATNLLAQ